MRISSIEDQDVYKQEIIYNDKESVNQRVQKFLMALDRKMVNKIEKDINTTKTQ